MNKAHSEAIRKAKQEQAARFAAQTITVDENWRIVRVDALNWQIQRKQNGKWCESGYYGNLVSAMQSLINKTVSEEASGSLQTISANVKAIKARIAEVLSAHALSRP